MTPIPPILREEMSTDPYYKVCARQDRYCDGRITWEHAWIYASKQIQEKWSIIPLCWYHHLGDGLDKHINQWIAIQRADIEELSTRLYKKNWKQEYNFLKSKYAKNQATEREGD